MKIVRFEANVNVQWEYCYDADLGLWVGKCDPLGVTAQAETFSELVNTSAEVIDVLLRDLLESGELDQFLRERGWQPISPIPRRSTPGLRFDIPMNMSQVSRRDHAAAFC